MCTFRSRLIATVLSATTLAALTHQAYGQPRVERVVDLSYPYDDRTVYWSQDDRFLLNVSEVTSDAETWYQVDTMATHTHGGTHLDAPLHFVKDGWDVAQIPVDRLALVPVSLVDIAQRCAQNRSCQLAIHDVIQWEAMHGTLPDRCVLLVHTGWDKFSNNATSYFGLDAEGVRHFPSVSVEAAQFLARERHLIGMGIDSGSLDVAHPFTVHQINARRGMYNLENLRALDEVPASGAHATVAPLKIAGASGSPVRVFAYLPETHSHGTEL
ncbi:isatin hydrolase-like [Amblyomma americanum]